MSDIKKLEEELAVLKSKVTPESIVTGVEGLAKLLRGGELSIDQRISLTSIAALMFGGVVIHEAQEKKKREMPPSLADVLIRECFTKYGFEAPATALGYMLGFTPNWWGEFLEGKVAATPTQIANIARVFQLDKDFLTSMQNRYFQELNK